MQIRELRKAKGMSLRQLARRSGLPPESVSRSERGITEITLTNLAKLCDGLLIDLPSFFQFAKQPALKNQPSLEMKRATTLLSSLPKQKLRNIVRGLELLLQDSIQKQSKKEEN